MTDSDRANARLKAKRALVVRDEAEQHDLVALADHALEDERLVDLLVDLAEDGRHLGSGTTTSVGHDRRADPLEAHRREALLPLVLGGLGVQLGPALGFDDGLRAPRRSPSA